ncbi:hypothetical protein VXI05_000870 [Vibrio parahaemolyticus]|nr:hypothetical protein [Vibrio parahaemolyticus]
MIDIWIKLFGLSCVVVATYVFYFRKKESRYNTALKEKNIILSNLRSELHKKNHVKQEDKIKDFEASLNNERKNNQVIGKQIKEMRDHLAKVYSANAVAGMGGVSDSFAAAMEEFVAKQKENETFKVKPSEYQNLLVICKPEEDNSLVESFIYDVKNNIPVTPETGIIQTYMNSHIQYCLKNIPDSIRNFNVHINK